MNAAVTLRTERLLLRPWRDEDVVAFDELNADSEVMQFLPVLPDWPARARAHWKTHGFGQWVVERPDIAGFIGVVGLNSISYPAHFTPAVEGCLASRPGLLGPRLRDRSRSRVPGLRIRETWIDRNRGNDGGRKPAFAPGHGAAGDDIRAA